MDEPPPREGEYPGALSTYRKFWSQATDWDRFILPGWERGPAIQKTKPQPAVYEIGVSMPQAPSTIVPLYIGQSVDVRQRHLAYARDGDHIRALMAPMVEDGHTIWQRVRYLETGLQAQRWEARFLVDYDYAWNAQLNPRKRDVRLEHRDCCCCAVGVDVVNPVDGARVSLLAAPLQSCTSHVWTVSLIFQVLLSITIICIVAVQLSDYSYRKDPKDITSTLINYQCLLGTDSQGNSLCIYTYVVSGGSIVLSIVLGLLAEFAFKKGKGWHGTLEAALSFAVGVWWAVASIVLTNYSTQAASDGVPQSSWRTVVWVLAWIETALWTLCFLTKTTVSVLRCCASRSYASTYRRESRLGDTGPLGASPPPTMPSQEPEVASPVPLPSAPEWSQMPAPQYMAHQQV